MHSPQMDTDEHRLNGAFPLKEETYRIIGCAMEVQNTLGHGFLEKPYENALAVEMRLKNIPFTQQPRYEISYKEQKVGEYIPDLVAFDRIIVELKTIPAITGTEKSQMINYLKATGMPVGLLLNFAKPKLEWERMIL